MRTTHFANRIILLFPLHATVNGFFCPTNIKLSHHINRRTFTSASQSRCNFNFSLYSTKTPQPPPIPNTEDPFIILGLSAPTADKKVIKRAYRRMALKYHPDVRLNTSSTDEERKKANDDFAKINAAYSLLTGKDDSGTNTGSTKGTANRSKKAGQYADYTPPHRRTTSQTRSTSSTDWEDFMPKYDDQQYDTNGDSFGAIFSDLMSELGKGSNVGSASILNDLVSFLEGNFPSVGTQKQKEEDTILETLLRDGTYEEIGIELEDAKLLVVQLEGKRKGLMEELETIQRDIRGQTSYMNQMTLEEQQKEIEARMEVIDDYLQRAKQRQMKLRRRRDELRVESYSENTTQQNRNAQSSQSRNTSTANEEEDSTWKRESFGSGGRRRGRSRASSSSSPPNSSTYAKSPYSYNRDTSAKRQSSSYSQATVTTPRNTYSSDTANLPPHRRVTSRTERNLEDKRRLREIKVDEEIDQMKKDLGL
mmetsp:Transcript_26656/g.40012  ORF Transcript_26656/g.40012 Transcript_26656/m.40012 type:complete len:479 (-) Transcript_26656:233-1669(-)